MKVAVVGSRGQYGSEIVKEFRNGHDVIELTTERLDITDYNSCAELKKLNPDVIVNAALFYKTENPDQYASQTFAVNAIGAMNLAKVSRETGAINIYISTDSVFNGRTAVPYKEDDRPSPINTYGISKYAGELYTMQGPRHYIIRSSSMFGVAGSRTKNGSNFVDSMVKKAERGEPIELVSDLFMSPTYAKDAAIAIRKIVEGKLPFGTYHAVNSGHCSWYDFARQIFETGNIRANLKPVKAEDQKTDMERPKFTVLDNSKLKGHGIEMRRWDSALRDYMIEKGYINKSVSRN